MGFKNLMGKFLSKPEDEGKKVPLADTVETQTMRVQFFMCFPNQTEAGEIRDKLDAQDFEVILRLAEDYTNWLVVVTRLLKPETTEFKKFEAQLSEIAETNDGEYQGWEFENVPGLNLYSSD